MELVINVVSFLISLLFILWMFSNFGYYMSLVDSACRSLSTNPISDPISDEDTRNEQLRDEKVAVCLESLRSSASVMLHTADPCCEICKRQVSSGEIKKGEAAVCPICENVFHASHLGEWLKMKGECPVCREIIHTGIEYEEKLSTPKKTAGDSSGEGKNKNYGRKSHSEEDAIESDQSLTVESRSIVYYAKILVPFFVSMFLPVLVLAVIQYAVYLLLA